MMKERVAKGFSQTYMAHKLGMSQKAYSYLESGRCKMDIVKFLKIAHIMETHPMEIINKISEEEPYWKQLDPLSGTQHEVDSLNSRINQLISHNNLLKDTVNKLLDQID